MESKRITSYLTRNYFKYFLQSFLAYVAVFSTIFTMTLIISKEVGNLSFINPLNFIMFVFAIEVGGQFNKMFTYLLSQSFSRETIIKSSLIVQILFLIFGNLLCIGLNFIINLFSNSTSSELIRTVALPYEAGVSSFGLSVLNFPIFTSLLFILMQGIIFLGALMYSMTFSQKLIFSVSLPILIGSFLVWKISKPYALVSLQSIPIFGGLATGSGNPLYPVICLLLIAGGIVSLTYLILRKVDLNPPN